ncbi:DUF6191 domain-containing protein [Streptomyces sp. NPDC048577]|uniref:DUF6191 domain-containing protein n=1 Tax=Streptomyces sp. NPDC048577 TaxID=3157209 RepID=UPI003435A817
MFNLVEELFAPGRRHIDEERRRIALTREDLGDGDPSQGPIDLTSGRVTIRVPEPGETPPAAGRGPDEDGAPAWSASG